MSRPREPAATERANPASAGIDQRPTREILRIIHDQDLDAWEAVGAALEDIRRLVDRVVEAFRSGGRLLYVGAGTSGRLGVLDATECPPTYGVSPTLVQGLIAGGDAALRRSVEGAEDSPEAGARAVREASVGDRDVVCGIASSGTTPFVHGALAEAADRGAATALLHSNPGLTPAARIDHVILLDVGPEVVAGSTRMKGGTATKMVLTLLTTTAMIRWGKVHDNTMVDVVPLNRKLERRARALIGRLAGVDESRAEELLEAAEGSVKVAVVMERAGVDVEAARRLLETSGGTLRAALPAGGDDASVGGGERVGDPR